MGPIGLRGAVEPCNRLSSIPAWQRAPEPSDGGQRKGDKGYFVEPTVLGEHKRKKMKVVQEEIFGPVVTAMPFDSVEEVMPRANDTVYGLAAGIWTRDISKAHRIASQLRAGTVWINCYNIF